MSIERSLSENQKKMIYVLLGLSATGLAMVSFRVISQKSIGFAFLIWNLFLAWIPFLVSLVMHYVNRKQDGKKKKINLFLMGFIWLIFYPNAPYIVTDIIHLGRYNYYAMGDYSLSFNSNFIIWFDFVLVIFFVFVGYILGHISLYTIHKMVMEKYKKSTGWIFVFIVSNLSGFAIYLGRFLRLNSWEVMTDPVVLIKKIFANINPSSLRFTMIFGGLIFFIYIGLYTLSFLKRE